MALHGLSWLFMGFSCSLRSILLTRSKETQIISKMMSKHSFRRYSRITLECSMMKKIISRMNSSTLDRSGQTNTLLTILDGTRSVMQTKFIPVPKSGEALVRIHACALRRTYPQNDIPSASSIAQGMAGIVTAVGEGSSGFSFPKVGERVGVNCDLQSQGVSEINTKIIEQPCRRVLVSEYMVADLSSLVRIPDDVDFQQAAAMVGAGSSAYRAVEALGLSAGSIVGIIGAAGTEGHIAVQIAKSKGLVVVALESGLQSTFLREVKHENLPTPTSPESSKVKGVDDNRSVGTDPTTVESCPALNKQLHDWTSSEGNSLVGSMKFNENRKFSTAIASTDAPAIPDAKVQFCLSMGADAIFDYDNSSEERLQHLMNYTSGGCHGIIVFSPTEAAIAFAMKGCRSYGTVVQVAIPNGAEPSRNSAVPNFQEIGGSSLQHSATNKQIRSYTTNADDGHDTNEETTEMWVEPTIIEAHDRKRRLINSIRSYGSLYGDSYGLYLGYLLPVRWNLPSRTVPGTQDQFKSMAVVGIDDSTSIPPKWLHRGFAKRAYRVSTRGSLETLTSAVQQFSSNFCLGDIVKKNITLKGSFSGSRSDIFEALNLISRHSVLSHNEIIYILSPCVIAELDNAIQRLKLGTVLGTIVIQLVEECQIPTSPSIGSKKSFFEVASPHVPIGATIRKSEAATNGWISENDEVDDTLGSFPDDAGLSLE